MKLLIQQILAKLLKKKKTATAAGVAIIIAGLIATGNPMAMGYANQLAVWLVSATTTGS